MDFGVLVDTGRGVTFGQTDYPNGGVYGILPPGFLTLLIVHRGAAKVSYDGQQIVLVGGECGVIANERFVQFTYQKHLHTKVSWCEIRLSGVLSMESGFAPKLPISERIETLLGMGLEIGHQSSATGNALRESLGRSIFAAYQFESSHRVMDRLPSRGLLRAHDHIESSFKEDMTVSDLAEIAVMSPNHFVSAFKKHFGTTPIRYLWKQRAAHAVRLLVHTGMTGSEIAYECGYKSPYHFSRHIRSVYGSTPTEIRKQKGYFAPSDVIENVPNVRF